MTAPSISEQLVRLAPAFASTALANVCTEYPHRLDQTLQGPGDLRTPRALHPVFYGSYDWHSCVHMHWALARLYRMMPALPQADRIRQVFDDHFMPHKLASEILFFEQPWNRTFERTYGWAWFLKLQTELIDAAAQDSRAAAWRDALAPLAELICLRYLEFLPLAQFPIRAGTHANSAFGLLFAHDYAGRTGHLALRKLIVAKAHDWFGRDIRYPAAYEPGGDDFLSGGLMEAACMAKTMDGCGFADWWEAFCPPPHELQTWLVPVRVTDRTDPKLVHLDGLNLSRAWCWKALAGQLPAGLRAHAAAAAAAHLEASLPQVTIGDYAGTHWLASFALLALE